MRILITGSRDWDDENLIRTMMMAKASQSLDDVTIVHGHCPTGADAIADKLAKQLGYQIERHRADWDKFGKRAGFVRNEHMVHAGANACLAFIRNRSKGATHCAGFAERAGIPVYRYLHNDI